ncbi:DHA2 family efflux MFS transporter permease subunit [Nocardia seriolae]|nr:DHA2 family efflux MFS transporter permease subunit [Nocardia seriolae]MTJ71281.1 DHA2 family efflux MFS transporter permease subunit [Nocardia seriolae]MTJ86893.1 DHA2 family efflux MFS transporter permease subunit [Nocardia seriolae]MTK30888.1 DHA2 family efflux MFS transporter permease subunit [Nocardia seriolae]MTK43137.1 DHA2 family efflux MFS transporter permease subunit [Nocardia seriolae]
MSARRKTIVLVTCCLSLLISSMDATIVNVAIPTIRTDLGAPLSKLQWIVDVYTLTLASLLMLSGAAADRFGRKRVFRIGLLTFAAGSLLCSIAPTIEILIGARFLQAIGGSMLNPVAMSIITTVFTGRVERARAVGVWGAVVGISTALGPMVGGVLIDSLGWQSVFWINLPIVAIALVLTTVFVPESKSANPRGMDPIGQVLAIATLFTLVFGLIETEPAMFALSALALAGFVRHESRHPSPFIDLRFFRSFPFSSATVIAVCSFAALGAFLFDMSLYLQGTRHFSAVHTGLLYLPMALGMLVSSPLSGRLVGRYGTKPSLLFSGVLMTCAAVGLTLVRPDTPIWQLILTFTVFGIGFGAVNAPITTTAVSGMPLDRAGAASAVASTSRQVGISLGVALCGALTGAGLWWTIAGFATAVIALGVAANTDWAYRSRDRIAPLLEQKVPAHAG